MASVGEGSGKRLHSCYCWWKGKIVVPFRGVIGQIGTKTFFPEETVRDVNLCTWTFIAVSTDKTSNSLNRLERSCTTLRLYTKQLMKSP